MSDKEKKVVESESTDKKPEKKAKKEKKTGKIKEAWRGFNSERKKIVWPNKKQVIKNTLVVLAVVGCCAVMIFALDTVFNTGFTKLPELIKYIKGLITG